MSAAPARVANKPGLQITTQNQQVSIPQTSQKVVTNIVSSSTNNTKVVSNNQGFQQLIVQPVQKLLVGQNSHGQKVIIQPSQQSAQATTTITGQVTPSQQIIPQSTNQGNASQQQVILNQGSSSSSGSTSQPQKVIQTIVNTSNVQQQIVVGGQRIILSPGQTILTQRSIPTQNTSLQIAQSPTTTQINSLQRTSTPQSISTPPAQQNMNSKVVKQFVVQPSQTTSINSVESQNNMNSIKPQQNSNTPTISATSPSTTNNQQQIIVQNSTLAQQLAQGKLQVATINGQQVIIKPLGNNQAQIVAHIKTQSDGNAHIVTNTAIEQQTTKAAPVVQVV